jgi:hypothetical protein
MRKNKRNQRNIALDWNRRDSPRSAASTPLIIGLRVYAYGPRITRFFAGLQGASVPSPELENNDTVAKSIVRPAIMRGMPRREIVSEAMLH